MGKSAAANWAARWTRPRNTVPDRGEHANRKVAPAPHTLPAPQKNEKPSQFETTHRQPKKSPSVNPHKQDTWTHEGNY